MKYRIESKAGVILGEYEGATKEDALQAMADEGGIAPDTLGTVDDYYITPVED